MSSMFRNPLPKDLADLVSKPKRRYLIPKPQPAQPSQPTQPTPATASTSTSKPFTSMSTPSSNLETTERVPKPDDPDFVPSGKFVDYAIVAADTNVKYNIMAFKQFGSRKVDLDQWRQPIKIYREVPAGAASTPSKDKRPGNNDAAAASTSGGCGGGGANTNPDAVAVASASTKGTAKPPRQRQRKTTRVYPAQETDALKPTPEDKLPWIIEEAPLTTNPEVLASGEVAQGSTTPRQVWIGELDYDSVLQRQGLLTVSEVTKTIEFAPVHLLYRFSKKRSPVSAKVLQKEYDRKQKALAQGRKCINRMKREMARRLNPTVASEIKPLTKGKNKRVSVFREEVEQQLRTSAPEESDLFGDDEDELETDLQQRRNKNLEDEGYFDDVEYEEVFDDDDDEDHPVDEDEAWREEERKERQWKEYRNANLLHHGILEDDSDRENKKKTTKLIEAGCDLKRLVRKREKNIVYDNDSGSERDPYISLEEDDESDVETSDETVIQPENSKQSSSSSTQPSVPSAKSLKDGKSSGSAAVEEQRPKKKAGKPRAAKPTAVTSSQAQPAHPTKAVPAAAATASGSGSNSTVNKKRKAQEIDEGPPSSTSPAPALSKFEENGAPDDARSPKKPKGELNQAMVIAFLKDKKKITVTECVAGFRSYLHDEETKNTFMKMIEKVTYTRGKSLFLRKKYAS